MTGDQEPREGERAPISWDLLAAELTQPRLGTDAIIPALIPWSIACAVPLATIGAPAKAIAFACFLYLLPAWELLRSAFQKLRQRGEKNFSTR